MKLPNLGRSLNGEMSEASQVLHKPILNQTKDRSPFTGWNWWCFWTTIPHISIGQIPRGSCPFSCYCCKLLWYLKENDSVCPAGGAKGLHGKSWNRSLVWKKIEIFGIGRIKGKEGSLPRDVHLPVLSDSYVSCIRFGEKLVFWTSVYNWLISGSYTFCGVVWKMNSYSWALCKK